jgi:hypothetical protein
MYNTSPIISSRTVSVSAELTYVTKKGEKPFDKWGWTGVTSPTNYLIKAMKKLSYLRNAGM